MLHHLLSSGVRTRSLLIRRITIHLQVQLHALHDQPSEMLIHWRGFTVSRQRKINYYSLFKLYLPMEKTKKSLRLAFKITLYQNMQLSEL